LTFSSENRVSFYILWYFQGLYPVYITLQTDALECQETRGII